MSKLAQSDVFRCLVLTNDPKEMNFTKISDKKKHLTLKAGKLEPVRVFLVKWGVIIVLTKVFVVAASNSKLGYLGGKQIKYAVNKMKN